MHPILQFVVAILLWMFMLIATGLLVQRARLLGLIAGPILIGLVGEFVLLKRFGVFALDALIAAIGGCFVLWNLNQAWRAKRASTWDETTGHILTSEVVTDTSALPQIGIVFRTHVEYSYSFGGHQFTSHRISPYRHTDAEYRLYDDAHTITLAYPKGKRVKVRYNPANPHEAYLETDITKFAVYVWVAGMAAIAIGIWLALNSLGA